jgi:hypothetical protein
MAVSRKRKKGEQNLKKFKEKTKKMQEQKSQQKQYLVPVPQWQSTENLDLRGDMLEALDNTLQETFGHLNQAFQAFNKVGSIMQAVVATNVKSNKITLKYEWNNGEPATEQEVAEFQSKMKEVQEAHKRQVEEQLQMQNAQKTGLTDAIGNPIGTTQNLDETSDDQSVDPSDSSVTDEGSFLEAVPDNNGEI